MGNNLIHSQDDLCHYEGIYTEGGTWPLSKKDVEGEKWEDAMKGGANGIFLAIVSVSSWYAQCSAGNERDECKEAIMDICWVLERMIEACKVVSEEESDHPTKRYVPNLARCLLTVVSHKSTDNMFSRQCHSHIKCM